ncbi:MAG: helix-turn-helix transcriptional regulator [Bdellovibrionota bacterium]
MSEQRRRELADFLRTRREKLKPEQVGIMHLSRRRTPGLRREEVAELAGVGTTWYTWLEQARDIQPSSEVLRRLALALRMNPAETKHLFALAGKANVGEAELKDEIPSASLINFLNAGLNHPAILLGVRWDILAVNDLAAKGHPDLIELANVNGNYLHHSMLSAKHHVKDWEHNCQKLVGQFRASLGETVDHPWVSEIVERLKKECPGFEDWWRTHDVQDNSPAEFELVAPVHGRSRFQRMLLSASENPRMKFLIFSPLD